MTYYLAIYFCTHLVGLEPVCADSAPYFMRNPLTGHKEEYSSKAWCEVARNETLDHWRNALKATNQDRTTVRGQCVEVKQ